MSLSYELFCESVMDTLGRDSGIDESTYEALVAGLPAEERDLCDSTEPGDVERFVVHMKILMRYADVTKGYTDLSNEDVMYITQKSSLTELPINYNTLVEAWSNGIYTIADALSAMMSDAVSDEFTRDIASAVQELNGSDSVKLVMT